MSTFHHRRKWNTWNLGPKIRNGPTLVPASCCGFISRLRSPFYFRSGARGGCGRPGGRSGVRVRARRPEGPRRPPSAQPGTRAPAPRPALPPRRGPALGAPPLRAGGGHGGQADLSVGAPRARKATSSLPATKTPLGRRRVPTAPQLNPLLRFRGRRQRLWAPLARRTRGRGEVSGQRRVNGGRAADRGPARGRVRGEAPPARPAPPRLAPPHPTRAPPRGPCACAPPAEGEVAGIPRSPSSGF